MQIYEVEMASNIKRVEIAFTKPILWIDLHI
jgi:hypothetical protein